MTAAGTGMATTAITPVQYSHGPVIYGPNGQIQSPLQITVANILPSANEMVNSSQMTTSETQLPLVPYGSTSQKQLSRPSFIVPPADVQIIIDKMASYVAKNGRDFEAIVKNKGDPRFNFLELSHQYHGYYAHKLTIYEGAVNPKVLTEEELLQKQEPQEEKQKKLEELQKKQQRMEEVQKRVKMIQAKKKCEPKLKETTTLMAATATALATGTTTATAATATAATTTMSTSTTTMSTMTTTTTMTTSTTTMTTTTGTMTTTTTMTTMSTMSTMSTLTTTMTTMMMMTTTTTTTTTTSTSTTTSTTTMMATTAAATTAASTEGVKQITTVSFSIKKPKDGETGVIEKRNALLLEESDDDMEEESKDGNSKPSSPQDSNEQCSSLVVLGTSVEKEVGGTWKTEKKWKNEEKELVDLTDEILEDCQKEIRHKQAEDRIKDKLVAAARDKLAATSRERQLQLERKKKAAAFLSQIQSSSLPKGSGATAATVNQIGTRKDDSDEVHSVPSPSPSPSLEDAKSSCDSRSTGGNSLMDRLKSADLTGKRSRPRSRSPSGSRSYTDRQKFHKKHKKKKSSHRR